MRLSSSFLILLAFPLFRGIHAAIDHVGVLDVVNTMVNPDGYFREAVLVNKVFPAPLIYGYKGDEFNLTVMNNLFNCTMNDTTSIHWHGIFQHNTNWADGGAFVSQCPIVPGHDFTYKFRVSDQAGTYWYHSHLSTQYCDGLRGPLVVYDLQDPYAQLYDFDDENTIITLSDWYHTAAHLIHGIAAADSTLINGLGRYPNGSSTAPLAVINVLMGKRYRLRLINMACDPNYNFYIEGHSMNVIEADGVNQDPVPADSIQIFAGQRYSFIFHANQTPDNYWIRAVPNVQQLTKYGFANDVNSAILHYEEVPVSRPVARPTPTLRPLQEADLHPRESPAAPTPTPGQQFQQLPFRFTLGPDGFYVNGTSFKPYSMPVLLQILSRTQPPDRLLPAGSVYNIPRNAVIEVEFLPNATVQSAGGPHPFHLHGHTFSVVQGPGMTSPNYVNPVRRDTVSLGGLNDTVIIRFETDNPGPWFLHCHIDFHLEAGMAVVLAEDVPGTSTLVAPPPEWSALCPTYENWKTISKCQYSA